MARRRSYLADTCSLMVMISILGIDLLYDNVKKARLSISPTGSFFIWSFCFHWQLTPHTLL